MKLRTLALAAVASLAAAAAGVCIAADAGAAPQRSPYWQERTSFFRAFLRHADVVMIGDSLTDGAEWREMFPERSIVNRGIDDDTTEGVLARLDQVVAMKPRLVFVMIGVNDFANDRLSVETVFGNYRTIVARLSQEGAKVFVQSTLPCNEAKGAWKSCASINGKIRQLNARLATLASDKVAYVDLTPVLVGEHGLKAEFTYDGVHLTGEGYRQWHDTIARFMQ
jgi:lysophospholipase L1-like esterase